MTFLAVLALSVTLLHLRDLRRDMEMPIAKKLW